MLAVVLDSCVYRATVGLVSLGEILVLLRVLSFLYGIHYHISVFRGSRNRSFFVEVLLLCPQGLLLGLSTIRNWVRLRQCSLN